ncbi:LytTR family DNA-binding domain-containing protein [Algoriphagus sp. CAU 1675]|uniref:LytR/AlgR family response regulator transcription factor n=1 Tax=Algoriphagus sp. CAU 1675 TaxID=3032597 RepID=UPI0023D98851|nr:LytTR family DNA-binding domain-containing protein [Algoriphagus sp. CAU 1675]MDF2157224.1 LytTR family DNA-binding domain-containing protein [Algoriphagus sp. CAU 1675]
MIRVVILEDEVPSRNKIKRFLEQVSPSVQLVGELDSIESGLAFFKDSPKVDLLISDIELLDGNAFQLFQEIDLPCPVIFTTAYNQFWMQAFEGNGIEYLLKPFTFERFQKAWDKFLRLTQSDSAQASLLSQLQNLMQQQANPTVSFKQRISVPTSRGSYFLDLEQIVCFFAENALIWALDENGKKHLLQEATLKELEVDLDQEQFFRISRSHLVHKKFVVATERYSKNSVAIKLKSVDQLLVCSQSQTPAFMKWIQQ